MRVKGVTGPPWWLTVVYGPQSDADKLLFMEELKVTRQSCSGPWAVIGDFNLILDEADKSNERINRELEVVPANCSSARATGHSSPW